MVKVTGAKCLCVCRVVSDLPSRWKAVFAF